MLGKEGRSKNEEPQKEEEKNVMLSLRRKKEEPKQILECNVTNLSIRSTGSREVKSFSMNFLVAYLTTFL